VDLAADQISRQGRQAIEPVLRKTVLDGYVAAIDIAGFAQAAAEGGREIGPIVLPEAVQESDHRHRRLLGAYGKRPRGRCPAEQHDELAALHSITSSASASNLSGIWSPSAFAVFRLITNSYFVGACTGRSAGLSPLRMRSTEPAARRHWSMKSGP